MKSCFAALALSVLVLAPFPVAAQIVNPSFEVGGASLLPGWTETLAGAFGTGATEVPVNGIPSDGVRAGRIYQFGTESVTAGGYASLSQVVDLSLINSITFDASLDEIVFSSETDQWASALEAVFMIDGVDYWTANTAGAYLDQTVDTSSLTGLHTIEFRNRAVTTADLTGISAWFMFDNMVAVVPEPTTATLLSLGLAGLAVARRRSRPQA
jgi:hypothetical protein